MQTNKLMAVQIIVFKPLKNVHMWLIFLLLLLMVLSLSCSQKQTEQRLEAVGKLIDVSQAVGIDFIHDAGFDGSYFEPESIGSGSAFFDYDNDGLQDIYLINARTHNGSQPKGAWSTNQLYRQNPDGTFTNVTEESGLGDTGYGMGVAIGDIDNDGDLDVFITNCGPDQLYENLGNGTFRNITQQAGITSDKWGCSVTFVDYDLDDYLDIYLTNYLVVDSTIQCLDRSGRPEYCGPLAYPGVSDVLYKNNGDGTFTDVSVASGIGFPERRGLGVVTSDFDFDGYPDIYVSNDAHDNLMWSNRKDGTFTDIALPLGAAVNRLGAREAGMGIALGDVTGNLSFDILVCHITGESNTLYLNHGHLGFEDRTQITGFEQIDMLDYTGFGVGMVDLNLDGKLDIAIGNGRIKRRSGAYAEGELFWQAYGQPNLIMEGLGGGKFENISSYYPEFADSVEMTRGVAFADYDNDGDIDILVNNTGGRAKLFKNEINRKGNWLMLTMFDPRINRIVIGTRVILTSGSTRLVGQVMPGYSFLCSNDYRIHFGLGQLDTVDKATVYWLDGDVEEFTNIAVNQHVTLEKGEGVAVAN